MITLSSTVESFAGYINLSVALSLLEPEDFIETTIIKPEKHEDFYVRNVIAILKKGSILNGY